MVQIHAVWIERVMAAVLGALACAAAALWTSLTGKLSRQARGGCPVLPALLPWRAELSGNSPQAGMMWARAWTARAPPGGRRRD